MVNSASSEKVIYPKLSYEVVGVLFRVHNELGIGYREKRYENAVERKLKESGFTYRRQPYIPVKVHGEVAAKDFADFIVDERVVLELKRGDYFSQAHINQVNEYLKATKLKLGIIAQFTSKGVKYKRILNLY